MHDSSGELPSDVGARTDSARTQRFASVRRMPTALWVPQTVADTRSGSGV